jgi:predicted GTPase
LQDYAAFLKAAEVEADLVLWDGGNNDLPFHIATTQCAVRCMSPNVTLLFEHMQDMQK